MLTLEIRGTVNLEQREKAFGQWLERRLELRGLSARQVAIRAGISPAHISKIINGKSGYTDEVVERIALALATDEQDSESVERLVLEAKRVAAGLPPDDLSPDAREMIDTYDDLPLEARSLASALLKSLRDQYKKRGDIVGKKGEESGETEGEKDGLGETKR